MNEDAAAFTPAFACDVPHGRLVAVHLPRGPAAERLTQEHASRLPDAERALAATLGGVRRTAFVGGRLALHAALAELGATVAAIGRSPGGAPLLPAGLSGSISHKADLALALAARHDPHIATVGVDLEDDVAFGPAPTDISRRVLTDGERQALAPADERTRAIEVRCAFALKEALYKALHPHLHRFIGFHEVELVLPLGRAQDGTMVAARTWPQAPGEAPRKAALWLWRRDLRVVATARVWVDAP